MVIFLVKYLLNRFSFQFILWIFLKNINGVNERSAYILCLNSRKRDIIEHFRELFTYSKAFENHIWETLFLNIVVSYNWLFRRFWVDWINWRKVFWQLMRRRRYLFLNMWVNLLLQRRKVFGLFFLDVFVVTFYLNKRRVECLVSYLLGMRIHWKITWLR